MSQASANLKTAISLHASGNVDQSEILCNQILKDDPENPSALHLLGVIHIQRGALEAGERLVSRATLANPGDASAHNSRGAALVQLGQLEEAVASFDRAIALKPDYADAMLSRGQALRGMNRPADAVASFDQAIAARPDDAAAHASRGATLKSLGRPLEALASYEKLIALQPDYAAYNNRGAVLIDLGRPAEALADLDRALALQPDPAAYNNRGAVLVELGRPLEALADLDRAAAMGLGSADIHYNRGNALRNLQHPDEALASYDRAVALNSRYAMGVSGRGSALYDLGRRDEALAAYDRALELMPGDGPTLGKRGIVRLALGDLPGAWSDYEYRRAASPPAEVATLHIPRWSGEALGGKSILVYAEQGFGDTIQFCRYLPMLTALGAEVTLYAPRRSLRLLGTVSDEVRLAWRIDQGAHFDCRCALLSLPRVFNTDLETIPQKVPYLAAEPDAVARWRGAVAGPGFKVGVCWQGNPDIQVDAGRSAPLAALLPIAQVPGVRLISLQKDNGLDQLGDLPAGMRVETLGDHLDAGDDAFIDTAAVMQSLDLVVSVDTAAAHLAGALGRPAFLALKHAPDWRWMQGRADSPWYPQTRLYRQARRGDWAGVFEAMAADISARTQVGAKQRKKPL